MAELQKRAPHLTLTPTLRLSGLCGRLGYVARSPYDLDFLSATLLAAAPLWDHPASTLSRLFFGMEVVDARALFRPP
jgi:hypothetical protein